MHLLIAIYLVLLLVGLCNMLIGFRRGLHESRIERAYKTELVKQVCASPEPFLGAILPADKSFKVDSKSAGSAQKSRL